MQALRSLVQEAHSRPFVVIDSHKLMCLARCVMVLEGCNEVLTRHPDWDTDTILRTSRESLEILERVL